jgi:hypothetical protein
VARARKRVSSPAALSLARIEAGWFGRPRLGGWLGGAVNGITGALSVIERAFIKPTHPKGGRDHR